MERLPSKSVSISDVKKSSKRIRLYGKLVSLDISNDRLTLNDGGNSVDVFLNNPRVKKVLESYKPGDEVMLVGWAESTGVEVEVIRKIKGFNPDRYKQILEVTKDVSSKNEQT